MRNPLSKDVGQRSESIFGSQAGSFFGQLITLAFALGLVVIVLLLAVYATEGARRLLYGGHPTLEPGQSTTIDGVTIKRIN